MNADARHGGLRPKRCLPAKFHSKPPTTDLLKNETGHIPQPIRFQYPQVTADHSHSPKERQLTLFYRLLPNLCRNHAQS
jgi:hypothetical protein